MESIFNGIAAAAFLIFGMLFGLIICSNPEIEIQDIRQVENGYYVTINDEIYYKE